MKENDEPIRVKITRQTTANKKVARVGDVLDLEPAHAKFLLGHEMAELAPKADLKQNPKPARKAKPAADQKAPEGVETKANA